MIAMTKEGIVQHSVVKRAMFSRVYLLGWLFEPAEKINVQRITELESTVVVQDNASSHGGGLIEIPV